MDVSKYKPGRRLDAMVAMALGWQWNEFRGVPRVGTRRFLEYKPQNPLADKTLLLSRRWEFQVPHFSTRPGAAFEAALEAGVLELRSIGQYEQSGVDFFEIDDGDTGVLAIGETAAHCLCLGILAIQPEDKLAEYESWLEGIE